MTFRELITEDIDLSLSKEDKALEDELKSHGAVIRTFKKTGKNQLVVSIKPTSNYDELIPFIKDFKSKSHEVTFNKQTKAVSIRIKKGY